MADPYIGEIRVFGFNFAPRGWLPCNGQLVPIQQATALYSILGVQYGGNGTTNFALPNFNNNAPMSQGTGPGLSTYTVGEPSGEPSVTLNSTQIPAHTHQLSGGRVVPQNGAQNVDVPTTTAVFALSAPTNAYTDQTSPATTFAPQSIGVVGGSQPHDNRQPSLALNYCICIEGDFPVRG